MQERGFIKTDKYSKNYAKSKRYRYIQEDDHERYLKSTIK
jgi:hypothetical protein